VGKNRFGGFLDSKLNSEKTILEKSLQLRKFHLLRRIKVLVGSSVLVSRDECDVFSSCRRKDFGRG